MLNAIIIEDERPALQALVQNLSAITPAVQVKAILSTVKEGLEYIDSGTEADLIFSDVQLSDGLSFDIFSRRQIKIPVIFVTAYNEYMINAFDHNGIDYLLKPVEREDLQKAVSKFEMLKQHFALQHNGFNQLVNLFDNRKRTRLVVKKGIEHITVKLEDIVLFYTENKIVYVIDRAGKKYLIDKPLSELEQELDERMFFRANRQYIINVNAVKGFKAYDKVKLLIELNLPENGHTVIVSQENAPAFRNWIYEA